MSVPIASNGKKSSNSSVVNTPASTPVGNANANSSILQNSPPPNNNAPKYGTLVPNRIFVGGISANTTEGELLQLFSNYGTVKAAKIIQDRAGVSKGYGFITFESEDDAKRPLREADTIVLRERKLNIAPAIKKQPFNRAFDGSSSPAVTVGNPTQYFLPPGAVPYFQGTVGYYAPPNAQPGDPNTQQATVYQPPPVFPTQTGPPQAASYPSMMFPQTIYMPQQYPMPIPYDYNYYPNNGGPPHYMVAGTQGGPGSQPALPPSGSPPRPPPCYNQQISYATEPPTMYYNIPVYGNPMDHPQVYSDGLESNNPYNEETTTYQSSSGGYNSQLIENSNSAIESSTHQHQQSFPHHPVHHYKSHRAIQNQTSSPDQEYQLQQQQQVDQLRRASITPPTSSSSTVSNTGGSSSHEQSTTGYAPLLVSRHPEQGNKVIIRRTTAGAADVQSSTVTTTCSATTSSTTSTTARAATPVVSLLSIDQSQERDYNSMQGGRRKKPQVVSTTATQSSQTTVVYHPHYQQSQSPYHNTHHPPPTPYHNPPSSHTFTNHTFQVSSSSQQSMSSGYPPPSSSTSVNSSVYGYSQTNVPNVNSNLSSVVPFITSDYNQFRYPKSHHNQYTQQQQHMMNGYGNYRRPRRYNDRRDSNTIQYSNSNNSSSNNNNNINDLSGCSSLRTDSNSSASVVDENRNEDKLRTNVTSPPPAPYSPLNNHGYASRYNGYTKQGASRAQYNTYDTKRSTTFKNRGNMTYSRYARSGDPNTDSAASDVTVSSAADAIKGAQAEPKHVVVYDTSSLSQVVQSGGSTAPNFALAPPAPRRNRRSIRRSTPNGGGAGGSSAAAAAAMSEMGAGDAPPLTNAPAPTGDVSDVCKKMDGLKL